MLLSPFPTLFKIIWPCCLGSYLIRIEINVAGHEKDHPGCPPISHGSLGNEAQGNGPVCSMTFPMFPDQKLTPDPEPQTDS